MSKDQNSSIVQDRYQVLKILGEGGMGVVQLVQDQRLNREVALKKIKMPSISSQKLARAQKILLWRFRREALITAILEHPNIIPLHDMQENNAGEMYFTMRKVEGETLLQKLRKKREGKESLSEHKILSIFFKICDAISYAHSRGVVHRDLKPENIMIGKFGEVYVMDWGIAKCFGDSEEELEIGFDTVNESEDSLKTIGGMGTPGYMPPEQKQNASMVTPQSDIYALGKILRECYLLLSPKEEMNLLHGKKTDSQRSEYFKKLEENIPSDILAIIEKATESEIERRYESVKTMLNDIEAYLHHRAVSVRKYSIWELFYKWSQRHKSILLLLFITLGLSFSFLFYSIWKNERDLQNKIQHFFGKFLEAKKNLLSSSFSSQQEISKKIKDYLTASVDLEQALKLSPSDLEMNREMFFLNKTLFDLACENQQYLLAYAIAKKLNDSAFLHFQTLPVSEINYLEQLKERQFQRFIKHQERLEYWIKTLNPNQTNSIEEKNLLKRQGKTLRAWDVEDAIYEISQMKEPQIVERLLDVLQEGVQYFSLPTNRSPQMDKFYITLLKIVNQLVTPANEDVLIVLLRKQFLCSEKKKLPLAEVVFFQELIKALCSCKGSKYAHEIEMMGKKFGEPFWKTIEKEYQKLITQE